MMLVFESAHRYAGCAIQGRAIEDGGGADNQAKHDQPVDHKVLQGVPPQGEQLIECISNISYFTRVGTSFLRQCGP